MTKELELLKWHCSQHCKKYNNNRYVKLNCEKEVAEGYGCPHVSTMLVLFCAVLVNQESRCVFILLNDRESMESVACTMKGYTSTEVA